MKRLISFIIILTNLFCSAMAEGILPHIEDTIGMEMPSFSSVLFRNPNNTQILPDGSKELVYTNVTDDDFQAFSIYLQESGCEMPEYATTVDAFTATINRGGKSFFFTYNLQDMTATLVYPVGTRAEEAMPTDVGAVVTFGHYEQDDDLSNGMEPIEWIILERQENEILLISKYILDLRKYNEKQEDTTWASSDIRKWLNDSFLNTAFEGVQKYIVENTIFTPDAKNWNGTVVFDGGGETIDKVYFLSDEEAAKFFVTNQDRLAKGSNYVVNKIQHDGNLIWFLRTVGGNRDYVDVVEGENKRKEVVCTPGKIEDMSVLGAYDDAGIYDIDFDGDLNGLGVRPVIRIKMAGLLA